MNNQSIINQIVSETGICASFLGSEKWFAAPFLSGANVLVYLSSTKTDKTVVMHVRWFSSKQEVSYNTQIRWDKDNLINCNNCVGRARSRKTKKTVTRFKERVSPSVIQSLLSAKVITFECGTYSEPLLICQNTTSVLMYLAYCYGCACLTDSSRLLLNPILQEIEQKEREEESFIEQERERIAKQKVDLIRNYSRLLLSNLINDHEYQFGITVFKREFKRIVRNRYYDGKVLESPFEPRLDEIFKKNGLLTPNGEINSSLFWEDEYIVTSDDIVLAFSEIERYLIEKGLLKKIPSLDSKNPYPKYSLSKELSIQQASEIIDGLTSVENVKKETVSTIVHSSSPLPQSAQSVSTNNKQGCYIASCVYGSYDCPEVWTLRRFRDESLAQTGFGRLFIKSYYAISPTLVRWFGNSKWFKAFWRKHLDYLVIKLHNRGVEDSPYEDKY